MTQKAPSPYYKLSASPYLTATMTNHQKNSSSHILLLQKLLFLILLSHSGISLLAEDWPTYRHDSGRSGASEQDLPQQLHLQWSHAFPKLIPSWLGEFHNLQFDAYYEPIVLGKHLFFASSDDDSITAINTDSGEITWRYYASGPIRLAPVGWEGKIYFGADDGIFYCLDADKGKLIWKFDTALSKRKAFIEGRLSAVSPIHGGPVLADGKINFTASLWPFENSALFSLDAKTGKVISQTEDIGAQGFLTLSDSMIHCPNGRNDFVYYRKSKRVFPVKSSGSWGGYWDHLVISKNNWLFRNGKLQNIRQAEQLTGATVYENDQENTATCFYRPILSNDTVYYTTSKAPIPRVDKLGPEIGDLVALSLTDPKVSELKDKSGKAILTPQRKTQNKAILKEKWRLSKEQILNALGEKPPAEDDPNFVKIQIKAGKRLYGFYGSTLFAVDIPEGTARPKVSWKSTLPGHPARIIAANDKLFVVTLEGGLYCFAGKKTDAVKFPRESSKLTIVTDEWSSKANEILNLSNVNDGYCLVMGLKSGRLIEELLLKTKLHIIAIDGDPEKVQTLRKKLSYLQDPLEEVTKPPQDKDQKTAFIKTPASELTPHRNRVVIYNDDPGKYPLPPFMASLIVSEDPQQMKLAGNPDRVKDLLTALRPYGGTLALNLSELEHAKNLAVSSQAKTPKTEIKRQGQLSLFTRAGAPANSADWTHEWSDPANTLKSDDNLKAPLGMLWTGGRSARPEMYIDRHLWPPSPVIMDGRMFIVGPKGPAAVDIYTGRMLWETHSDAFSAMTRFRGGHWAPGGCHTIGAKDGLYVSTQKSIIRFDPATGDVISEFHLPQDAPKDARWGRPRIWKQLIITSIIHEDRDIRLLALDQRSGSVVWEMKADYSFSQVAIGNGKVFCWDGIPSSQSALKAARRGVAFPAKDNGQGYQLKSFDASDGTALWRNPSEGVVEWLSYSEKLDVVVASTKKVIHALRGQDGGQLWRKYSEGIGFGGHPDFVWQKVILWNDWMIDQRGPGLAYDLLSGKPIERNHPVTQKPMPWKFDRNGHHCNHAIASENLLTFRSDVATYVDLNTLNTSAFPGFRSGCTNSLLPAGGVLSSPMYSRGCVCNYNFFTSTAFTHIPKQEAWNVHAGKIDYLDNPELGRVQHLGINFSKGGARRSSNGSNGTVWFGLTGNDNYFRLSKQATNPNAGSLPFEVSVESSDLDWVFSTGLERLKNFTVQLSSTKDVEAQAHTVRLYFIEPQNKKAGERLFSVKLQDQEVLKDFDIALAAGGSMKGIVKEFPGIMAGETLSVSFTTKKSLALLCGIEVINEQAAPRPVLRQDSSVATAVDAPLKLTFPFSNYSASPKSGFKIITPPTKGALSGKGPDLTYTAKSGSYGFDSFDWEVKESSRVSHQGKVTIKLLTENIAPHARDLKVQAITAHPVSITLPFADPDKQPGNYRFELLEKPLGGTVEWISYNRFSYTSKAGFSGNDTFTWKVNDGDLDSKPATVTLQVKADTTPPAIKWIDSSGSGKQIKIVFTEALETSTAQQASNYLIDHQVLVQEAKLSSDMKSVILSTSPLSEKVNYTIIIRNIKDLATRANVITPQTKQSFNYHLIGNGLLGEYFEGPDFAGKKIGQRIDPFIDVSWKNQKQLPFETMKSDQDFSVRWTGKLKADHTEEFTLYLFRGGEHNHNPARVWLDGKLLSNEYYGPVSLQAGKVYDLKVELNVVKRPASYADYYSLRWSSVSTPKQTIPRSNLGTSQPK
ncbi:MAG: PQQ-binding-like beta-propeller repeat protein [Verrucomicrobiota bacterium]